MKICVYYHCSMALPGMWSDPDILGMGSFRWLISVACMISPKLLLGWPGVKDVWIAPLALLTEVSVRGSNGVNIGAENVWFVDGSENGAAGAWPSDNDRKAGRCTPLAEVANTGCSNRWEIEELELDVWNALLEFASGRIRGLCAGVTKGVWSGVGLSDSWLNEGDEGAVEWGEAKEGLDGEWARDMEGELLAVEFVLWEKA